LAGPRDHPGLSPLPARTFVVQRLQIHSSWAAVATLVTLAAPPARPLQSQDAVQHRSASSLPLSRFTGHPSTVSSSRVHSPEQPQATTPFGPTVPPADSRSALALSQRPDGLLRIEPRGPIASRIRSWDSHGFRLSTPATLAEASCGRCAPSPRVQTPLEVFPSPTAGTRHRALLPS
jgi:hypothetical protein